ncbi:MAG TPA: serine hydrolase domain-containing protein, partial [Blastocatellia bacterium]
MMRKIIKRNNLGLMKSLAALAAIMSLLPAPLFAAQPFAQRGVKRGANDAPGRLAQAAPESVGMSSGRLAKIDEAVLASVEREETPGAAVLVARQGRVVYRKAFGSRATSPAREPMTLDTIFDLASLTKVIATATSIMILVERGKVSLADPVALYIPEFGKGGKERVTVEQLMTHRAGLPPDNEIADYVGVTVDPLKMIYELQPSYEPGSRFVYSDVGYIVAAELVRRVSGKRVDEFARENIFAPLGMKNTSYLPASHQPTQRIAPTETREGHLMRGEVHDPRSYEMGGVAGHAGLFSTVDDVAIFCQMILNKGEYDGARILAPYTIERMVSAHSLPTSQMRGIGWDVNTSFSSNRGDLFPVGTFGHTGFTGTSVWLDPASQTFVVLLTNRVHPAGRGDVTRLRSFVASVVAGAIVAPPYGPIFDFLGAPPFVESPRAAISRAGPPAGPLHPVLTGI